MSTRGGKEGGERKKGRIRFQGERASGRWIKIGREESREGRCSLPSCVTGGRDDLSPYLYGKE